MALADPSALRARARALAPKGLNGLRLVQVVPDNASNLAKLDVQFQNSVSTAAFAVSDFHISGGHRVLAGKAVGQVKVTAVATDADATVLHLTVAPIGDYSTYTLIASGPGSTNVIDPIFSELDFKFRPACFNIDCAPDWRPSPAPTPSPAIDYLAKDYDSFRHTLITAMQGRVSGWTPTSEVDLTQVLIDLFAAAADELSDFQDRVMNEAYFLSSRKRVSLARYARLMDYHIYQGNQASTWLALYANTAAAVSGAFPAVTTRPGPAVVAPLTAQVTPPAGGNTIEFLTHPRLDAHGIDVPVPIDPRVNELTLYTWSGTEPALGAGDTSADLQPTSGPLLIQADADAIAALFNGPRDLNRPDTKAIQYLLIQEHLNPQTGAPVDFDRTKRQLLQLVDGVAATSVKDPLTGQWAVRVSWEASDALQRDYCFITQPVAGGPSFPNVSLLHGNLVRVYQGSLLQSPAVFRPPGTTLVPGERHWFDTGKGSICRLDPDAPVLYRATRGADAPTRTTVEVKVQTRTGTATWTEDVSLVHRDGTEAYFIVETDELLRSVLRFGNGTNGMELANDATVKVQYQSGQGVQGNVGADTIARASHPAVVRVWNPFDVTDGADPEPVEQIIRNVPQAFLADQLRAITLADYVRRAEEVAGVQRAAARYGWTGSWRTVRITIDPIGTETLAPSLVSALHDSLDAVKLLGEDTELRPPKFVPLVIDVQVCVDPDYWPEDVQAVLEQEFSVGYTPGGQKGFFHPDNWTFGQQLYASEIEGRIQSVPGVAHVISLTVQRWNAPAAGDRDFTAVGPDEIIEVDNDPDHMELGSITFTMSGGRQ